MSLRVQHVHGKNKLLTQNPKKKRSHSHKITIRVQNVINNVLLGGRHMRAMVMLLRSYGYMVMLTSLRESFMGEGGRNGEEQERETRQQGQHPENMKAVVHLLLLDDVTVRCQTSPKTATFSKAEEFGFILELHEH